MVKPNQNTVLVLNETTFLKNLEHYGMFGVRHSNDAEFMSGLCLYVSNSLRTITSTPVMGRFTFSCKITFPAINSESESTVIGIIGTYRNPKYNNSFLNDDYFTELEKLLNKFYSECDLTYLMGDLNCYNTRYKLDYKTAVEVDPSNPAVKSYHRLFKCFTGNFHSMFTGPTHTPRSTASKTKAITCSQLD